METIELKAKLKKNLSDLLPLLKNAGFTSISYSRNKLAIKKSADAEGAAAGYEIIFTKDAISLRYEPGDSRSKGTKFISAFSVFMHVLALCEPYYQSIDYSDIFSKLHSFMNDVSEHLGKDAMELATELDELKAKHADLSAKYSDLVRSSEENARLLLECERRRDELQKRVAMLEGLSDEALKQERSSWIKVHGGLLNASEFSKTHGITTKRVEEGIELLISDGYIRRRSR